MALNKLRGELKAIGVTQGEVADLLGMTTSNFNRKLAEAVPFTRDEMFTIKEKYFPETSLDHLFASDGDVPTKAESLHAQVDAMEDAMRNAVGEDDPEVDEIIETFHAAVEEWAYSDKHESD